MDHSAGARLGVCSLTAVRAITSAAPTRHSTTGRVTARSAAPNASIGAKACITFTVARGAGGSKSEAIGMDRSIPGECIADAEHYDAELVPIPGIGSQGAVHSQVSV